MKKRGKRSCTEVLCALTLAVAAAAAAPEDARGGDSFLLPGVALSDAEFVTGSWCRYLVVDEIMGALDTTTVYIAVTGEGQYISELYIKRGSGAVEPADPADLEQLTLSHPTSDSDWVLSAGVTLETPQGRLLCDHKHLVVEDKREIPMGRVTLIKNDSDVYDVWFCEDVPIFRVAKCVIERLRDSRTVPSVPGIPNKEREESRTTVELVGFGSDAVERIRISK
jgi:hypothetical protein